MAKQRAALLALLGQPIALVDGRDGLVRAVAASYDGGRGLRPLFRQVGHQVARAGAECVPGEGKVARRLAQKLLSRRLDVGIFAPPSEPSNGTGCPASSECMADATSSLGGRCVDVSFAQQRRLQGVQDDLAGYCEAFRSSCEYCAENASSEICAEITAAQYCEKAEMEGTGHYSQACLDFFGGEEPTPLTPPPIATTVSQEMDVTPVTSGGTSTEEEERKFQICQSNCPDIAVCDCVYSDAPSATYDDSACVSTIASACRSGILPSCGETGEVTFDHIAYCPIYECYEKVGELIPLCSCGSYKGICEYCDGNSSAEICIDGLDGQIMNMCENAPVDGTYHYSQTCIDYFNGVMPGTTASAATESAQTTDATTATEESTTTTVATEASAVSTTAAKSESTTTAAAQGTGPTTTTTKATIDGLGFADTDGGSPPSSAGKAAIGLCAAALAALSTGISHCW